MTEKSKLSLAEAKEFASKVAAAVGPVAVDSPGQS